MSDVERMLRSALVPVEPSGAMNQRLERRLSDLTGAAAEELADWELSSMRDPRNWYRPAAAVVVGGAAAGALVVVRARQQRKQVGGLRALRRDPGGGAQGLGRPRRRPERAGAAARGGRGREGPAPAAEPLVAEEHRPGPGGPPVLPEVGSTAGSTV